MKAYIYDQYALKRLYLNSQIAVAQRMNPKG